MSWEFIFSLTNAVAMLGWVMLAVVPRTPLTLSAILYLGVGLLCLVYFALFISLFGNLVDPGRLPGTPEPNLLDYSLAGLKPLFMSDGGIVIGWNSLPRLRPIRRSVDRPRLGCEGGWAIGPVALPLPHLDGRTDRFIVVARVARTEGREKWADAWIISPTPPLLSR